MSVSTSAAWQTSDDATRIYANVLVPVLFGPWAEDLVARAQIAAGERVLDLACGTGAVAAAAARAATITALDRNPAMLEYARSTGIDVDWQSGFAEDLPFPSGSFDLVLCQQGFQFFSDRTAAATEVARVLRPGGRALASVWRNPEENLWAAAVISALETVSSSWGESMRKPFSLSGDQLASLFDGGFKNVRQVRVRRNITIGDTAVFAQRFIGAVPFLEEIAAQSGAMEAVTAEFTERLNRLLSNGGITSAVSVVIADRA
jgi:ubiquinone/menaquinone biosynthesis C-methylase UbiE